MDADILAAKNDLELSKIKAQEYRNEIQNKFKVASKSAQDVADGYADLAAAEMGAFKGQVILALIPKVITATTATTDATILADAAMDVKRLKAYMDEILKL